MVRCTGSVQHLHDDVAPGSCDPRVPLVPSARPRRQGWEVPLGGVGSGTECSASLEIQPSSQYVFGFISGFFWGGVYFFCFPLTGSDVALAPIVTCFTTSSFNNVSTDLNWSFTEHSLSSRSCAVSPLWRYGAPGGDSTGGAGSSLPHR